MDVLMKLGDIDKRVLYVLLVLVLLIPMVRPIGIRISISHWTTKAYEQLSRLEPGDTVICDFGYNVDGAPDVEPIAKAIFRDLFDRNIKIITVSLNAQGPMIAEKLLLPYEESGKVYGTDFCNLGFMAGGETALAAYARDLKRTFPRDWRGNTTSTLPILQGITGAPDTKAWIFFTDSSAEAWVRQVGDLDVPMIGAVITVAAPQAEPFVHSGQLSGLLTGLRSAAEYEIVTNRPGGAVAAMDAQSLGHILITIFIVFGNISYFVKRSKELAGREGVQ
ncbi:MAG TPA: hypothetical protein GX529_03390 [Firmicutes bacterium]|nr:hypothetical protein [Candidatus Fermentithermobacillaceae bacterium]